MHFIDLWAVYVLMIITIKTIVKSRQFYPRSSITFWEASSSFNAMQREDRTEEIVLNMICSHFLSFPTATFREQTFLLLLLVSLILLLLADYDW